MIEQVPRRRDVSFRVGAKLRHVSERVEKVSGSTTCIGAAQRRIAALPEEARAYFLDGYEVVPAYAAEPCYKSFPFVFVEFRCLVDG
jgi:hypothetical protein